MAGSERLGPAWGPLGNLSQAYFSGFDAFAKGCEPALVGVGRMHLEVMRLASCRAQEWLEYPARLGGCKSPQDLFKEQMRFWQTAAQNYADGSHRMAQAFSALTVMPGVGAPRSGKVEPQLRDYLSFREPAETQEPKQGQRRAA
jgi:hypothetical protein